MKKEYMLKFPGGIEIDINNVPEDFDAIIAKAFSEFTQGTHRDYTCQDKLYFIDLMRNCAHRIPDRGIDANDKVNELIKERFAYELEENGKFANESDFLSVDFMVECYEAGLKKGARNLYEKYGNDHHIYDKVMQLLFRAIKVVIEWEEKV